MTVSSAVQSLCYRFPRHLTADYVEKLHSETAGFSNSQIIIDLAGFRGANHLAVGPFLGLLHGARRRNISMTLRMTAEFREPIYGSWRIFTDSVLGLTFTRYCDVLDVSGINRTSQLKQIQYDALNSGNGILGSGKEISAPAIDEFPHPYTAELLNELDEDIFHDELYSLMFRRMGLPEGPKENFRSVFAFVFETIENTRDHALMDLSMQPVSGLRFLYIRRMNFAQEPLSRLTEGADGPLKDYATALVHATNATKFKPRHLIEITVADCGVGIPATMTRRMSIYQSRPVEERLQLERAIQPLGSTKPAYLHGRGLGLYKAMLATKDLKGMIVFRTGRMNLYKHYLAESESISDHILNEWSQSSEAITGTSVSIVFPWPVSRS